MVKNKAQKAVLVVFILAIFAGIATGIAYVIHFGSNYPAGVDTMSHVYKGNALYHNICDGNWYPLYDRLWYNGVQTLRYWEIVPVYVLAFCQMLAGGNEITGYLVYVGMLFFLSASAWLYIGVRRNRIGMGAFIGCVWFFLPDNLYTLLVEGNLPRAFAMVVLPLLFYEIYEYLFEDGKWRAACKVISVFTVIVLCGVEFAGMIVISMLVFLFLYRLIYREKGRALPLLLALLLPFLITGIWLCPSLWGEVTSVSATTDLEQYFQSALISLNPFRRISAGNVEVYFGLAALLLALFSGFLSNRKVMTGCWTAVIIFVCTLPFMYPVFEKLPGGHYLHMLQFVPVALCMILYSLMMWNRLRRWILLIFCVLLIADIVPSLSLVYSGKGVVSAQERMEQMKKDGLIEETKQVTKQRAAVLDGNVSGGMTQYLLTDYNGKPVQSMCGVGWQYAQTRDNIVLLNEAVTQGYYLYLFDRSLELGNDTVLIKISQLENQEEDVNSVTRAAQKLGYELVASNTSFLLYHLDAYDTFGTKCTYQGIGIGTSAPLLALSNPDIEEGESKNLSDYSYEQLKQYKLIYLAGFTYDNKEKAEELLKRLAAEGVRIVIAGDGIPENRDTKSREFLGVTCQNVIFENGYPLLYYKEKEYDCALFERSHRTWQTVYFLGLEKVQGYLYEDGRKLDFLGTAGNDNIYFVGLNLTYHYMLTHDEYAGIILHGMTDGCLRELPERTLIPLRVEYGNDFITIESKENTVNTSIAFHDIFESNKGVFDKRNLMYVNEGETFITMEYPYFWQGIAVTVIGLALSVAYMFWMKRRG